MLKQLVLSLTLVNEIQRIIYNICTTTIVVIPGYWMYNPNCVYSYFPDLYREDPYAPRWIIILRDLACWVSTLLAEGALAGI